MTHTESHDEQLQRIKDKIARLLKETGHEPLEPANQYCRHCAAPLFIKEHSVLPCPGNPMRTKNAIPLRYVRPVHIHRYVMQDPLTGAAIPSPAPAPKLQWYAGTTVGWVDIETVDEELDSHD